MKRRTGAPKTRIYLTLTEATIQHLRTIAGGNVSAGVEALVARQIAADAHKQPKRGKPA